jgi:FkbM family methyltransferase
MGSEYGGWVIPTSLVNSDSICYCVGCGEDITFDLALIEHFQCEVYGFDPTPRAINYVQSVIHGIDRYHFSPIGLWDRTGSLTLYAPQNPLHVSHSAINLQNTQQSIEVSVQRLSETIRNNGHSRIDLLKIDIEGAEYCVLDSIIEDGLDIKVICAEYDECHTPINPDYRARIRKSALRLRDAGYQLVSVDGKSNYTFVKKTA